MLLIFAFISIFIQISFTDNAGQSCGCSVGRNYNRSVKTRLGLQGMLQEFNQCPLNTNNMLNTVDSYHNGNNNMVLIPEGIYQVGTDEIIIENDKEGPEKLVSLKSFFMDKYEVSNIEFAEFAYKTGYKTEAEVFNDSFVFLLFLNTTTREALNDFRVVQAPWWYKVDGANWKHPYGPDSDIAAVMDHPVIHVSWRDAQAYCKWRNARLPTEAEWEAACRGGHRGTKYPWGDKLFPDRKHMANIWQGTFPNQNSAKDGYVGTSPVHQFHKNDFGLYNMAGNVWEWTEDTWLGESPQEKVKKGGSYLCHRSYCYRYRCSARSHNTEDSSAGNLGFRCAKDAAK